MATNFGPPVNDTLFSSDKPWVWAMIPVGFVVVVGALALCLHSRRRKKHFEAGISSSASAGAARLDPAGTRALERDLEEAWVRGATPTRRPPAHHYRAGSGAPSAAVGRWSRPNSRWNWAGFVRQEEGLNELGEAPPPYEKPGNAENARKSSSLDGNVMRGDTSNDNESVELRNLRHPPPPPAALTITRATSTTISMYGEDEMGESARTGGSPPPMVMAQQPPPYESDGTPPATPGPIPMAGGERREDPPPLRQASPPAHIGGYDDGTATVSVTPLPPAVLRSQEQR